MLKTNALAKAPDKRSFRYILLTGASGVGKSRWCYEFLSRFPADTESFGGAVKILRTYNDALDISRFARQRTSTQFALLESLGMRQFPTLPVLTAEQISAHESIGNVPQWFVAWMHLLMSVAGRIEGQYFIWVVGWDELQQRLKDTTDFVSQQLD